MGRGDFLAVLLVEVDEDHEGAFLGEFGDDACAEAGCAAGDDGDFVG